jgi:hypothetical protein
MQEKFQIVEDKNNHKRRFAYFPQSGCYRQVGPNSKEFTDPSKPHVCGVGYYAFSSIDELIAAKKSEAWKSWNGILARCYSPNRRNGYIGVSVHKDWHNFNQFREWHDLHQIDGWEIDKDLLSAGSKIYSSDTCCFIPGVINASIRGGVPPIHKDNSGYFFTTNTIGGGGMKIYLPSFDECKRAAILYKQGYMRGLVSAYRGQFCKLDRDRIMEAILCLYDDETMERLTTIIKFKQ